MADLFENPIGTDGFAFVEYTSPDPKALAALFTNLGFTAVGTHKRADVTHYRQGNIHFFLNNEPTGPAAEFRTIHGASASAMGFKVHDAPKAYETVLKRGGKAVSGATWATEDGIAAIDGIGGAYLYLVDDAAEARLLAQFNPIPGADWALNSCGLTYIDHLTHNLKRGNMAVWANYYEGIFNFREIRYFDIEGKVSGLVSKAMTSPCGKIRIPLNESQDDISQIEEFIKDYNGEGIQHIALGTDDIYQTVPKLKAKGIAFQDTPDTYYDLLDDRVKNHGEATDTLRAERILLDGAPTEGQGLLLQIFTQTVIGPVFFEIIQRKGNEGFGEGNFKALFESIELDQIRRGVIAEKA
jgi:4-hydroxyphenylpyruvate dioxygenase